MSVTKMKPNGPVATDLMSCLSPHHDMTPAQRVDGVSQADTPNVQLASNLMTFNGERSALDPDFCKHVRGREAIERMWEAQGHCPNDTRVREELKRRLTPLQQLEFEPPCGLCGRRVAGVLIQDGRRMIVDLCKMGRCYCFRQEDEKSRPRVFEFEGSQGLVTHGNKADTTSSAATALTAESSNKVCVPGQPPWPASTNHQAASQEAGARQVEGASSSPAEKTEKIANSYSSSVLKNLLAEALDWLARVEETVNQGRHPPDRWRQSLLAVIERIDKSLSTRSDDDAP